MMVRVLVQVDEVTHGAWKARAFAEGRSMSDLARQLIEREVLTERGVGGVVAESRSAVEGAQKMAEGDSRTPAMVGPRSVSAVQPKADNVPVRPHMKKHRPAVECSTRIAEGVCPDCGQEVNGG